MRTQEILLKSDNTPVIIDHDSRQPCKICGKEISLAANLITNKPIYVNLVSLAEWDRHECKKS